MGRSGNLDDLHEKLSAFVKREVDRESQNGFSRLASIPDSSVQATLDLWRRLGEADRAQCLDALAVRGARLCGLVREPAPQSTHPFERRLDDERNALRFTPRFMGVPLLRAAVSQYKIDKARGISSSISEDLFAYAASIRSVKAPELRKSVKAAFATLGLTEVEKQGGGEFLYRCQFDGLDVAIAIDYGGRTAQLRYGVSPGPTDPTSQTGLSLERTLGIGLGWWDLICEETLGASMRSLCDCVRYAAMLPSRFAFYQ